MTARQALVLALVAFGCFALGWWVGRQPSSGHPVAAPSAPPVDIRVDAGSVELLPDGGLHLRPIPPLDLDASAP
jgi:hypothetical protein